MDNSNIGLVHRVFELHPSYEVLKYSSMFIKGEDCDHIHILIQNVNNQPKIVSGMQLYSHRFIVGEHYLNDLHFSLNKENIS